MSYVNYISYVRSMIYVSYLNYVNYSWLKLDLIMWVMLAGSVIGWLNFWQIHKLFTKVSSVILHSLSGNCFTIKVKFFTSFSKSFGIYITITVTNILNKETINICTNLLCNNVDVIESINKSLSLRTFYPWLPRNHILFLTIFFLNKRTVRTWDWA